MSTMLDEIDSAHMTQGSLSSFAKDRFGCPNSSLALNGGWTQVPPGIYFDTQELTITVWIYPQQFGVWARVIDFGNGPNSNNIVIHQYSTPVFVIFSNTIIVNQAVSAISLQTNKWQFLAVTLNFNSSRIYIDGQLTINLNKQYTLQISNRTNCFIGKSNWAGDGYSYSYLDDLRFYNKSLSQEEILELMNYENQTSRTFHLLFFSF
jgi:arabinan endo-1,5-alpha-L-arabinosidase